MKPGIIFCGYGTSDLTHRSLAPWIKLRKEGKCHICAVSVKFADFTGEDDGTTDILRTYLKDGLIDHLIDSPNNIPETIARGMALEWLKNNTSIDNIWMVDSDEIYTLSNIANIFKFVDAHDYIAWFKISFKNYIFDENTFLTDAFTPPRIFRLKHNNLNLRMFIQDNDIGYSDDKFIYSNASFPNVCIPMGIAWITHLSWLNNERSKRKVEYQLARWNNCSFVWNYENNCLAFNPKLPIPEFNYE